MISFVLGLACGFFSCLAYSFLDEKVCYKCCTFKRLLIWKEENICFFCYLKKILKF